MKLFGFHILTNKGLKAKLEKVRKETSALSAKMTNKLLANYEDLRQSFVALKRQKNG